MLVTSTRKLEASIYPTLSMSLCSYVLYHGKALQGEGLGLINV